MTRLWKIGVFGFLFLAAAAWAQSTSDLDGFWKLESEYPGRSTYYFKITGGESHLVYPPEKDFAGQVPHAGNTFSPGSAPGEYVLSPMVQTPDGPKNLFAALAEQTKTEPRKSEAFRKLSKDGLTYRKDSEGKLEPVIPDELKTWLPKLAKSSPDEAAAAKTSGDAFEKSVFKNLAISFPKTDQVMTCPDDLKPLLEFSKEAFDEAKKISRFQPVRGDDAKVLAGTSKLHLYVQASPSERAIAFYFFEGEKSKWGPLKMYKTTGNQWVIPDGDVDPVTKQALCQRVLIQPALPIVRGDPATGTSAEHPK